MNLPRASRARRLRLRTTSIAVGVALAAGPVPFLAAAPASAAAAKPAKHYDDFNGDGYRDLAVSHTHDGIFAFNDRAVLVTYGGPKGLTAKKQVIHQNSPGIPGASKSGDDFGTVLASADLNRDGYADLVVGNPSEEAGRTRVGSVTLVWGSAKGLKGGTALPRKATNGYGTFGADIATGDFNGAGAPTSRRSTAATSFCTAAASPSPADWAKSASTTGRARAGTATPSPPARSTGTGRPT
ncbi:FG-GAP repeat protein [Streptomyces cyaneofuscatus]|uniref:FG-GAP repeat protein n=1 Tax=Streptomyces cyaneofuscatus TaxID=66883 RepID=UPI0036B33136